MTGAVTTPALSRALSPWPAFAVAAGAVFLVAVDATIAVAAFPALRTGFPESTPAGLSWVLNAYTIVYAALLVPAGRLVDLRGARPLFVAGVLIFTLGSALCGAAPSAPVLVAARILQAVGGAILTPASLTIALAAFAVERRTAIVGLWSAAGALGAALGPGLGGALIEAAGWRAAFLVNLPVGALLAVATRGLPMTPPGAAGERLDWPGVGLIIAGMAALTWGVVSFEERGGATALVGLACGLAAFGAYVAWARGRADAAIDLALFAERTYAVVTAATFVFGIAFAMMFLSSFLFLVEVWGSSQGLAGLALIPGPLVVIGVAIGSGPLIARIGHRAALVGGGLLYAQAQGWLWARVGAEASYWNLWFPGQIVGGTAVGLLLTGLAGAAVAGLPAARLGVGGAVNNATRQLGGVIGTAVAVILVGSELAALGDFRMVFLILAALGLATAVLCLPIQATRRLGT